MKVNKVDGIVESLIKIEDGYEMTVKLICLKEVEGGLVESINVVKVVLNDSIMQPKGEFAEKSMMLLEEYNDLAINFEANDAIREMYFAGKVIDSIAADVIGNTNLTRIYSGLSEMRIDGIAPN